MIINKSVHLKQFDNDELLFDENETVIILKFIFMNQHELIDELIITDAVRGFAQGLLLEAVDSSYAMGFLDALFGSLMNPTAGVKKVIVKFGRKSLKHWFSHASTNDLMRIQIYDIVRNQLSISFLSVLKMHANGVAKTDTPHFGILTLHGNNKIVWG